MTNTNTVAHAIKLYRSGTSMEEIYRICIDTTKTGGISRSHIQRAIRGYLEGNTAEAKRIARLRAEAQRMIFQYDVAPVGCKTLENRTGCAYPYHTGPERYVYCNRAKKAGSSYCEDHHKLMFNPAPPLTRRKENA